MELESSKKVLEKYIHKNSRYRQSWMIRIENPYLNHFLWKDFWKIKRWDRGSGLFPKVFFEQFMWQICVSKSPNITSLKIHFPKQ